MKEDLNMTTLLAKSLKVGVILVFISIYGSASAFNVPKIPGVGGGGVDVDSLMTAQDVVRTLSSSLRNLVLLKS